MLNLLTNALDSVEEEGTVRIELAARDGMAELSVADDGCGMEPEVLERRVRAVFHPPPRRAGHGSGLSIAHRIVADHGGAIEAAQRRPRPGRDVPRPLAAHADTTGKQAPFPGGMTEAGNARPPDKENSHRYQALSAAEIVVCRRREVAAGADATGVAAAGPRGDCLPRRRHRRGRPGTQHLRLHPGGP